MDAGVERAPRTESFSDRPGGGKGNRRLARLRRPPSTPSEVAVLAAAAIDASAREGVWSLTVTKNWQMTFRINDALAIEDMDLEDYH